MALPEADQQVPDSVSAPAASAAWTTKFMKGVGMSVWQNSSDTSSNWSWFAKAKWPFKVFGTPVYKGKHGPEVHSNFWENFEKDIVNTKALGCTSFRFSIEWSRLEPTRGVIDQEAVKRYSEMLDVMEREGLVPSATLHHFVHPLWFQELGGWLEEKNLPIFVEWCKKVFALFGHRIHMWATFNEPTTETFLGYVSCMMPPGNLCQPGNSGKALLNMCKAHVMVYKAIKAMPHGDKSSIGFVHHFITFRTRGKGLIYFLANYFVKWGNKLNATDTLDEWIQTGHFTFDVPLLGRWIDYQDPEGKPPCDWWGVNYYSQPVLAWYCQPTCFPGDVMSDFPYPLFAEGLYKAIKQSSRYGMPMYITETGAAAEAVDDQRRRDWINDYWAETQRAIADGFDVRGWYYWTLIDNFEWAMGYTAKFGLYTFDAEGKNPNRVLKPSAKPLVALYNRLPDDLGELRALAVREKQANAAKKAAEEAEKDGGKKKKADGLAPVPRQRTLTPAHA